VRKWEGKRMVPPNVPPPPLGKKNFRFFPNRGRHLGNRLGPRAHHNEIVFSSQAPARKETLPCIRFQR